MGIRIYDDLDSSKLVARGFVPVHVPKSDFRPSMATVEDWCLKYLQGEFALRVHYSGQRLAGYFQSKRDAMLFALRWS
jgi:hypothetical protein